jgi:para-nitrobenzyl esterase
MNASLIKYIGSGLIAFALVCCGNAATRTDSDPGGKSDIAQDSWSASCPAPNPMPRPGKAITILGAVQGVDEGNVVSFKGVPYAYPPVGNRRFRAPEPIRCWPKTLQATSFGSACAQIDKQGAISGSEDCLTLNIWVPKGASPHNKKKVLFFIHGGANVVGSSAETMDGVAIYDGAKLAAHTDSVVVTINYRLGPFGWLTHSSLAGENAKGVSGNYGTLDQLAALWWVRTHIFSFGGDSRRVLLFGQSGGAVNTCVLLTSPLARGLFSAVTMQSGGCGALDAADAHKTGNDLVKAVGCDQSSYVGPCLRSLSSEQVLEAVPVKHAISGSQRVFQPNVDGYAVPNQPLATILAGQHNSVPVTLGSNADETSMSAPPVKTKSGYEKLIRGLVPQPTAEQLLQFYPAEMYATPRKALVALTTDAAFTCNTRSLARALSVNSPKDVYRYYFDYALENNPVMKNVGAYHGLEVLMLFGNYHTNKYTPSAGDYTVTAQLMALWSEFGATGGYGGAQAHWPIYNFATDPYLQLGSSLGSGAGLFTEHCDFWDTVVGDWRE